MAVDVLRRNNKYTQRQARRTIERDRQNYAMHTYHSRRQLSSYYYWHATRGGGTFFIQSKNCNSSLCITTAWNAKRFHAMGSSTTHRTSKKLHGSGTQLPYSVQGEWEWLTHGNNYRWWKLDQFLQTRKKIWEHSLRKKEEEEPRKFKNERSAGQKMLMTYWDCRGLVYTEFGPDTHKDKQNFTQFTYFDTVTHLKNAVCSKSVSTLCRAAECNTLQLCHAAKVTRHMPSMRSRPHEKRIFCRPSSRYQNCGTRSVNLVWFFSQTGWYHFETPYSSYAAQLLLMEPTICRSNF